MKKILLFIISLIIIAYSKKVFAYQLEYSDWSEEYPYYVNQLFIQSEDMYLWYRDYFDNEKNQTVRETTSEYYKELDGYIKIESSKKTFYRYITNEYVMIIPPDLITEDISYCSKNYCIVKHNIINIPSEEPQEEVKEPKDKVVKKVINPNTKDNIFVFLILSFISFVTLVLTINYRKINLVLSNRFK